MIISASYRTDIPAFYGDWFMHRLRAGFCQVINPCGGLIHRRSLLRQDVDGIVFWTKNIGPFLKYLPEIASRGFPFIVQHAINGYPRELERAIAPLERAMDSAARLAAVHGPRALVWRYDPIILSSLTPFSFHVDNFGRLAHALRGISDEVTISFLQAYQKTRRHLDEAAHRCGFLWHDPDLDEKRCLVQALVKIAHANDMQLSVCAQRDLLVPGAVQAHCIDARRLSSLAATPIRASMRGKRKGCGCFESRDIGAYDSCPHGCVYCYAVQNPAIARSRFRRHNPLSEFLFEPKDCRYLNETAVTRPRAAQQLELFSPREAPPDVVVEKLDNEGESHARHVADQENVPS